MQRQEASQTTLAIFVPSQLIADLRLAFAFSILPSASRY